LAALSQKARNKNEDEFAFGMLSANKAQAGKHGRGDEQSKKLSHDAVKLLKSQDAGYLRVVAGSGRRELQKLEEVVGMASSEGRGTKLVFVDGDEDEDLGADAADERAGKRRKLDDQTAAGGADQHLGSAPGPERLPTSTCTVAGAENVEEAEPSINATASKSKKALAAERDILLDQRAARKRRKRRAELHVAKLEALKKRQREIMAAADVLDLQRAKIARTVGGVNKDGVKWKIRERKR
jgi:U3 small nucleolar RNA-associated protein 11